MKKNFKLLLLTLIMGGGLFASEAMALDQPVNGVYQIGSAQDLKDFADMVNAAREAEKNAILTNDIVADSDVHLGAQNNAYKGVFDGNGHTITVHYTATQNETALFNQTRNATIKNLLVNGTITTTGHQFAGGIIANAWGSVTVENCVSMVTFIDETNKGTQTFSDGTHGGIIACLHEDNATVIVNNCAFIGGFDAPNRKGCGGIIGWPGNPNKLTISNCYVGGTQNLAKDNSNEANNIICRNNKTVENCYWDNTIDVQDGDGHMFHKCTGADSKDKTDLLSTLKPISGITATNGKNPTNQDQGYDKLFDNSKDTKWCIHMSNQPFVEFQTTSPIIPTGYILTTGDDTNSFDRNPRNWTLKARLNSSDEWTTLVSIENDNTLGRESKASFTYSVNNPFLKRYQYFLFEPTGITGDGDNGGNFQLSELEILGNWLPSLKNLSLDYPLPFVDATITDNGFEITDDDSFRRYARFANYGISSFNAILTSDVTLSDTNWPTIGWEKCEFTGHFDGQGHSISSMHTVADYDNQALFGRAYQGALIENVIIDNSCSISGKTATAGILSAVYQNGVTIRNCGNEATIIGSKENSAGILGCSYKNSMVVIENCYNTGNITGEKENAGICAWLGSGSSTISNCYSKGTITGGGDGIFRKDGVSGSNLYLLEGLTDSHSLNSFTSTQLANGTLCYLLNGPSSTDPVWHQTIDTDEHPVPFSTGHEVVHNTGNIYTNNLTDAEYFTIANAGELTSFAEYVNRGYVNAMGKLTADINMNGSSFPGIGTSTYRFRGIFDGQKHIISNLKMNIEEDGVGFFRYVTGGTNGTTIKRFTIDSSCSFTGNDGVGAFIGRAQGEGNLLLEELGNEANVIGNKNAAGILGVDWENNVSIIMNNCYNTGKIESTANEYPDGGALSGWMGSKARVTNCYNIGEIVGGDNFARGTQIKVKNCYATNTTWAEATIDNESFDAISPTSVDKFSDGTVFASLFDYKNENPAVNGNVWRMEFNAQGNPTHPVLYDAAIVYKEDFPNRPVAKENADVTLYRTVKKGGWNTVCMPFAMNSTLITDYFGGGTIVAELDADKGDSDNILHFKTVTSIEAGKAYLVYPDISKDFSQKTLNNISITAVTPNAGTKKAGYTFKGVYEPTSLNADVDRIVANGNTIVKTSGGNLKGFRAYFEGESTSNSRPMYFVVEDETTGIISIGNMSDLQSDGYYDLLGRKMVKPANKGLYIQNGNKVIK